MPKSADISASASPLPKPVFHDSVHHIKIFQGDCLDILAKIPADSIDLIFADPPYFLSNDGITCHAGRMVSVNKGQWDRSPGPDKMHDFNRAWLEACQRVLQPNGSIWVSGTSHVIHSVGFAMQQLGFKLLNDITWVKPNPPPNLSCRYFTHATETLIWAAKNKRSRHTFHYRLMKEIAGGKQMKSVWPFYPPSADEKRFGKHPTQKPVALLERIILAASNEKDLVLDPFMGSGSTAIAAIRASRLIIGIEAFPEWNSLALRRIIAELIFVQISVDLCSVSVDRSVCAKARARNGAALQKLVQSERKFYFIGANQREVIYSVEADSLDEAWQKFHATAYARTEILFVIKTETEIYLAQGT
ncbi:MAG: site-specific DNA-methyltransferase [Acidobacteria bacterium]|nr:site-specific DNA-methyltransferase [Acidobacteriota bacterium]MCL5288395.1 site-specific DNA-methyltransferase [Acidobacteriota bacterium]